METINKDLSVLVDDTILNIRVVVLLKSEHGYVFEKSTDGYIFALGGRVKLHESTAEACAREILEEVKLHNIDVKMAGVIENFFNLHGTKKYHEINFVFRATLKEPLDVEALVSDDGNVGYLYVLPEDFDKYDIRPKALKEVITSEQPFFHVVNRD